MNDTHEETAQQIASAGREALLERLRPAFRDAAAAHADVITLSSEQIEEMVQRAADRADGLQWRRALAGVAVDKMGITLADALGHPAVVRAQEILGVPSYEEAIAAARAARAAKASDAGSAEAPQQAAAPQARAPAAQAGASAQTDSPAQTEAAAQADAPAQTAEDTPGAASEARAEPAPAAGSWGELATATAAAEEPDEHPDKAEPDDDEEDDARDWAEEHWADVDLQDEVTASTALPRRDAREVTLPASHVEGLGNLAGQDTDVELSFTQRGLDVLRSSDKLELVGLRWRDIHALEVPSIRARARRRRRHGARLVVYSTRGTLTFETPGRSADEVRSRLAPFGKLR